MIIDGHVLELDHLLGFIVHDCFSYIIALSHMPPYHHHHQTVRASRNPTLSSRASSVPRRKSIECLYMTPKINRRHAPLAFHDHQKSSQNRRSKSASDIPHTSDLCIWVNPRSNDSPPRSISKDNYRTRDGIVLFVQCNEQQQAESHPRDEEDTLALVEGGEEDHFCDAEGSVNTSIDSDTSVITVLECSVAEHERDKA